jgi:DNA-binding MarR family transcriptional regulator
MSQEPSPPAQQIVALIRRMVSRMYVDSKGMTKRFGLTGPQVLVMRALLKHGAMSSADLSNALYVTASNLTGIIDRLEQKGFVARTNKPSDRRVRLLALTAEGIKQAESLPDPIEDKLTAGLARLDVDQVAQIHAAFETVVDCMNAQDAPDAPLDLVEVAHE